MHTASDIIERLGGSAAVARGTRFPLTTIEGWKEVNFIPQWRQQPLLALAKERGLALTAKDFPTVDQRRPRKSSQPTELRAS